MSTIIALATCCVSTLVAMLADTAKADVAKDHKDTASTAATAIAVAASIVIAASAYAFRAI